MLEIPLLFTIVFMVFIVFIVYVGYPSYLAFRKSRFPVSKNIFSSETNVYHILPMYNEESVVSRKIENSLEMKFPHPMKVVIVIDLSTDKTAVLAQEFEKKYPEQVIVVVKGERKGKNDSINLAINRVCPKDNDILFFSDSNTIFDQDSFLKMYDTLCLGYGLVGGSMKYLDEFSGTAVSEGLYWKYEEWIRRNEAKIGRCVVVNGGNLIMVARHYRTLPDYVPNDLEAPLRLCGSKVSVGFCAESEGKEQAVQGTEEEFQRKSRMAVRQMSCIRLLWTELDFKTKVQIMFRKVLRWSGFHLTFLSYLLMVLGYLIYDNLFIDTMFMISSCMVVFIFTLLTLYICKVRFKINEAFFHAIMVHKSSFNGMVSSFLGQKVSVWAKAESNRV